MLHGYRAPVPRHTVCYVERNPVRVHTGKAAISEPIAVDTAKFAMDKRQWKKYLSAEDEQVIDELRLKKQRGLVIDNQGFVKGLEKKLKRSLECLNPGRPKQESH